MSHRRAEDAIGDIWDFALDYERRLPSENLAQARPIWPLRRIARSPQMTLAGNLGGGALR